MITYVIPKVIFVGQGSDHQVVEESIADVVPIELVAELVHEPLLPNIIFTDMRVVRRLLSF